MMLDYAQFCVTAVYMCKGDFLCDCEYLTAATCYTCVSIWQIIDGSVSMVQMKSTYLQAHNMFDPSSPKSLYIIMYGSVLKETQCLKQAYCHFTSHTPPIRDIPTAITFSVASIKHLSVNVF